MEPKMTEATDALAQAAHARKVSPRADLMQSVGWVILGGATVWESLRMDRLEHQDINPYTIPGLLPACLGVAMVLLGLLMAYRSIARGALQHPPGDSFRHAWRLELGRIWLILTLCVGFALGLVGRGLSFWMAAAAFVTVTVVILQSGPGGAQGSWARRVFKAALIGLGAGWIITLVFQEFFLVRLP